MKKLLCSAAVCGLAFAASPAHAASDGLKVDLGGFFKGYGMYTSQDDESAGGGTGDSRNFDIIRNTEIHFGGETVLDNGLTVGVHVEAEADGNDSGAVNDSFDVNESYAYFSNGMGRINFGSEDGAAYLLQVEAPSADSNLDGLRQSVNPVNYAEMEVGGTLNVLRVGGSGSTGGLDYDQDISGQSDKLTYLSPIMNGFQAGVSYTPDVADASSENAANLDNVDNVFGSAWDVAARYEGQFNNVGVIVGAGYTNVSNEHDTTAPGVGLPTDDRSAWNAGVDLDIGPFGLGVAYLDDDHGNTDTAAAGEDSIDDEKTWDVGADYTTGPFKIGVSYLHSDAAGNIIGTAGTNGTNGITAKRWTGGVIYTYGPGMTFRGSVSHVGLDDVAGITVGGVDTSPSATSVLFGTQIDF